MLSRILWLDDEWQEVPEQLQSFRQIAEKVDCAASIVEARKLLSSNEYDAILVDMILTWGQDDIPDKERLRPYLGTKIIEEITGNENKKRPCIIVFTIASDERLQSKLRIWRKKNIIQDILVKSDSLCNSFEKVAQRIQEVIQRTKTEQLKIE